MRINRARNDKAPIQSRLCASTMSQHQKERHAAAMLVHNLGSGIEALEDLPPTVALENKRDLEEIFFKFSRIILRLCEIELVKHAQLRAHQ